MCACIICLTYYVSTPLVFRVTQFSKRFKVSHSSHAGVWNRGSMYIFVHLCCAIHIYIYILEFLLSSGDVLCFVLITPFVGPAVFGSASR